MQTIIVRQAITNNSLDSFNYYKQTFIKKQKLRSGFLLSDFFIKSDNKGLAVIATFEFIDRETMSYKLSV